MAYQTLGQLFTERAKQSPMSAALRVRSGETYRDITWKDLSTRMAHIAAGLLTALPEPLEDNAPVAIIGNTSADWIALDFGALSVGLRTVPIYASLLPPEVGYVHADTQAIITIVENADQLAKVREIREGFTFFDKDYGPDDIALKHIVVMDPTGIAPADDWESLADLEARGAAKLEETREDRERRLAATHRQMVATYTYTSGTTGPPKAVIQTHENMLSMIEQVEEAGQITDEVRPGGLFLFLPLAHSFGRLIEFAGPFGEYPIVISSIPTLGDDLAKARPGFFPAAPRVYEKMKSKIETTVAGAPPLRQRIFGWALETGKQTVQYRKRGRPLPLGLRLKYKVADRVVFSKLRARLGLDRCATLLSGSAPLSAEVQEFFVAMGLPLLEAYGLTETCPGLTSNAPGDFEVGTVGKPFPQVQIKIAEDGEILAKGPNITQGYLNRPEATAEAFDDEGWFHTGDLGSIDAEGFVKITGRKKELIKTSGGKYVAPAKIEGKLKALPFLQEAVVIGDNHNYCVALVAVDLEELTPWAEKEGVAADPHSDAVNKAIKAHVDAVNNELASFESIKYFRVLPEPLSVENGLLTASLKVKRKVVESTYADLIGEMYDKSLTRASK